MLEPNVRLGKLRQDQFAYEDFSVIDTVIMGHEELWAVKAERDRIYSLPEMSRGRWHGGGRAGSPVRRVRRLHRRVPRRRAAARPGHPAGAALRPDERRRSPAGSCAYCWPRRCSRTRTCCCSTRPTNHLDINTIRWLEGVLTARNSTMIIISHDHFLNSVCTHMADLDYARAAPVPGQLRRVHDRRRTGPRAPAVGQRRRRRRRSPSCNPSSAASANASKAKQATSRARQIDKIQLEEVKPSSWVSPFIRFEQYRSWHRQAVTVEKHQQGL